jgi:hypothetical protein
MTKQEIIDHIKEIVVDQCELEPEQRQGSLGSLFFFLES